jgi:hypothetical protein
MSQMPPCLVEEDHADIAMTNPEFRAEGHGGHRPPNLPNFYNLVWGELYLGRTDAPFFLRDTSPSPLSCGTRAF